MHSMKAAIYAGIEHILIIGGGTIGRLCLAVAKAIGVKDLMVTVKQSYAVPTV
jgi:threonine dehydrogenase-like Zn-dependent dehydrogenase